MDFSLNPELLALKERVRAFVEQEVIPCERLDVARDTEALDAARRALQARAKAAGLYLPQLPPELGGLGLPWVGIAVVLEEAGRSLPGPGALNAAAPDEGNLHTLNHLCNPEQRERYLQPLAAGNIRSCFSMTEPAPGAGSDPGLLMTTAARRDRGWAINGKKWFITGADGAAFSIVLAKTEAGATLFLVDTGNPGFRVKRIIPTMDTLTPGGHCEIDFIDCEIGDDAVLGEVGRGFEYAQLRLGPARLTHCMRWLGAAARATEIAADYAAKRQSFGRRLAEHQSVQNMIADSHIEIHAARMMVLHAAWKLDQGQPIRHESSMTKVFVSDAVNRIVDRAVQICGALGVSEDTPLSHFYREMRPFRIYDGANEVHRMSLANRIFHKRLRP